MYLNRNNDLPYGSGSSSNDESIVNSFIFSDDNKSSQKTVLYEELRLIERNESEINVCWKGAHMMLFFMSFVFGSVCTSCIHRLRLMFGEKCVLFPKLVTHSTVHRMVHEFFSFKTEIQDLDSEMPVEFVTTQWAENSVCYLPTYVPLVSGLAGLVWTTMFLMCSSGTSNNVTGAQRHWRALPLMLLFCATMSVLCLYASAVTHSGLQDLCSKLADATNSPQWGFTLNVATLAYNRRIRGVYQATVLSIVSAWLHTICWMLSTLLIVARVLLAVDFTLVHVRAQLVGNLDDILQKHEKQMNYFNAEAAKPYKTDIDEDDSEEELYATTNTKGNENTLPQLLVLPSEKKSVVFDAKSIDRQIFTSVLSLVPEERQRLLEMYIHELLYDLLKKVGRPVQGSSAITPSSTIALSTQTEMNVDTDDENAEMFAKEFTQKLHDRLTQEFDEFERQIKTNLKIKSGSEDEIISEESDDKKINNDNTDKYEEKIIKKEISANETKENSKSDKVLSSRSYVRFNVKSNENIAKLEKEDEKKNEEDEHNKSEELQNLDFTDSNDGDRAAQKKEISNNYQIKDDENEQKESNDKDKPRRSSDDDDDDDRSAPKNKSTSEDPKQGETK
ncbi:uncharacterized protein LOC134673612 [Cydia fagiglandana]|uniref:uncharacterized protein LOC134673612 n=1 Tax=Cydia fagiglandana TaxID=1458189 RepID=UPI002FEDF8ED